VAAFFASPIFLLILMFVVFYFLLIRPQQKKQKEHQKMLQNLKKGDDVVTASGIFGKVTGITDNVATIEIADKVRIKILRAQIAGIQGSPMAQDAATGAHPAQAERK
jgi:preprotein translocase subunit YajC